MASGLLEIDEARRVVLGVATPSGPESVALDKGLGRVLGEDVRAEQPVPAFDNSAMDGFAVRARDVARADGSRPVVLVVIDESRAGAPARAGVAPGQAIAISTGAVLPEGADTVVPVEDTRIKRRVAPGQSSAKVWATTLPRECPTMLADPIPSSASNSSMS